jgi:hypothetical protein
MTAVLFKFSHPDGTPVADAPFLVTTRKPSFDETLNNGIQLPGDVEGVTDAQGEATLELMAGFATYYLLMDQPGADAGDDGCVAGLRYRFMVVESSTVLHVEDLIVTTPTWSRPWDEVAIQVILDAKIASIVAADRADEAAVAADASELAAKTSEDNAKLSEDAAKASELVAGTKAGQASASQLAAKASEDAAQASEEAAAASALSADASADFASGAVVDMQDQVNAATLQASNAATSASQSATSASAAATSATAAATSATASAGSATAAAGSATASASSATAANVSKLAAAVSEANAAISAANAAVAASAGLDKMPDNWVANPQFLATGTLITIENAGQSTTYVDRNAAGVPAGFSSMRVGKNLKKTSNTLGAVALPLVNNYSYIPVVPNQSIDVSVEMACTGNLTTGSATARLVLVEFDLAGTLIANTRLLAYDNVVGGLQTLQGTLTTGPNTYRVTVGVWNETAMPVDGTIYFGSPAVTKRQASVSILQQNKMNAANPRFTGALSGPNTTEPLPILTSGYTTGLGAYNSGALSGNPSNAFVSQGFSFSTANLGPQFIGARSYGVQGAHGAVLSGRSCVTLMGLASDGANYQPIARMDAYTEENTTPTASGGEWQVWTTPIGANRPTLAARFRNNGDFSAVGKINGVGASFTGDVAVTGTKALTTDYRMGINRNAGVPYLTMSRTDLVDGTAPGANSVVLSVQGKTGSVDTNFDSGRSLGWFDVSYLTTGGGSARLVARSLANVTTAMLELNGDAGEVKATGTVVALGKIDARASIDEATTQAMASAASLNLTAATSNTISVTGTTTITSLGAGTAGVRRLLKFAAALTLTHNSVSLILPGGTNILTAANDVAEVMCLGGSNWVCYAYSRASGQPLHTVTQALGGTGRSDGRVLFSEVGVQAAAALFSTQGLYMGWNAASQGEGHFVVNRGVGAGGYNWRSVNSDNTASGPSLTYSYAGLLTTPTLTAGASTLGSTVLGTGSIVGATNVAPGAAAFQVQSDQGRLILSQGAAINTIQSTNPTNSGYLPLQVVCTNFYNDLDGGANLGNGAKRWSSVFAVTGTINTSDAREKTPVRALSAAEISAGIALSKEIGSYKFLSAIAEKGDAARQHIGMTVQRAIEIMESYNLAPLEYAFICYDEWAEVPEVSEEVVLGSIYSDGELVQTNVPPSGFDYYSQFPSFTWEETSREMVIKQAFVAAGNRYGFRYDQLAMFIARGQEARLSALEASLAALSS